MTERGSKFRILTFAHFYVGLTQRPNASCAD
jgi:hypothetical protein